MISYFWTITMELQVNVTRHVQIVKLKIKNRDSAPVSEYPVSIQMLQVMLTHGAPLKWTSGRSCLVTTQVILV